MCSSRKLIVGITLSRIVMPKILQTITKLLTIPEKLYRWQYNGVRSNHEWPYGIAITAEFKTFNKIPLLLLPLGSKSRQCNAIILRIIYLSRIHALIGSHRMPFLQAPWLLRLITCSWFGSGPASREIQRSTSVLPSWVNSGQCDANTTLKCGVSFYCQYIGL